MYTREAMSAPTIGAARQSHALLKVACCDHWPQHQRRVESGARESSAHDNIESDSHADRQRRKIAGVAGDRRVEHDGDQEEGEHRLDHEAAEG
jgi:hypothetical protein